MMLRAEGEGLRGWETEVRDRVNRERSIMNVGRTTKDEGPRSQY